MPPYGDDTVFKYYGWSYIGDNPETFHTNTNRKVNWNMNNYPNLFNDTSEYSFTIKFKEEEPMTEEEKEVESDIEFMEDNFKRVIELRKEQGYVTYGDLADILDLDPDTKVNPFRLYVGNWDEYQKWLSEEAKAHYRKYEAYMADAEKEHLLFTQCKEALDDKDNFEDLDDEDEDEDED